MVKKDCLTFANQDNDIVIDFYPVGSVYSKTQPIIDVQFNTKATIV